MNDGNCENKPRIGISRKRLGARFEYVNELVYSVRIKNVETFTMVSELCRDSHNRHFGMLETAG